MKHQTFNLTNLRLLIRFLVSLAVILISGCYPGYRPSPYPVPEKKTYIGRIEFNKGSNAFINGRKARQGDAVYDKDRVATGDETSVSVLFQEGGFLQLDANTDPDFSKWLDSARCLIKAFIQVGQVYGETGTQCDLLIEDAHLEALAHTRFNLEVRRGYSVLSVIEGEMQMQRPPGMVVKGGQRIKVFRGGRTDMSPLSRQEIKEILRWRLSHDFDRQSGWCCADSRFFQATLSECGRRGGRYSEDRRRAQSACEFIPAPEGFCCSNGSVAGSTEPVCKRKRGLFFTDEKRALKNCRPAPQPETGWCCLSGNVFKATDNDCSTRRGQFSSDYRTASSKCKTIQRPVITVPPRPSAVSGFCCSNGKISFSDRSACSKIGGQFYNDRAAASKMCMPVIK